MENEAKPQKSEGVSGNVQVFGRSKAYCVGYGTLDARRLLHVSASIESEGGSSKHFHGTWNDVKQNPGILKAGIVGAGAWAVYGVVESVLSFGLPLLWDRLSTVEEWQWPLIAWVFAVYLLCGFLTGCLSGALIARLGKGTETNIWMIQSCLPLTVVFVANLITAGPLGGTEVFAVAVGCVLTISFIVALRSVEWQRRTRFLASPWMVSLLLLCAPAISLVVLRDRSAPTRLGAALFAVLGIVGFGWLLGRRAGDRPTSLRRAYLALATIAILWIGIQTWDKAAIAHVGRFGSSGATDRPNVLLITMDTVRADHLSVYGYGRDTSPNLNEFAAHATVFDRAIAASNYTLPSHASIFTGQYPSWHGAYPSAQHPAGQPLPPGTATLARIMAANRYWTVGVAANSAYLRPWAGLDQGFESWYVESPIALDNPGNPFYLRERAIKVIAKVLNNYEYYAKFSRASDVNSQVNRILDKNQGNGPFFMFVNYMDAHFPYVPPSPFFTKFSQGPISAHRFFLGRKADYQSANKEHEPVSEDLRSALIPLYDGGISYVDFEIGKLLSRLRQSGLYENTLIIITSDHGEAIGDHGILGHIVNSKSLYQELVHVPLIVKYPGQQQGERLGNWVSLVDILPTTLDVAGISRPAGLQGESLRSTDRHDTGNVFTEAAFQAPQQSGMLYAAFSGPVKLITSGGNPEMYDLDADPAEAHNLFRPDDLRAASLITRLKSWIATIPTQRHRVGLPTDPETLRRLKSLNYVQ